MSMMVIANGVVPVKRASVSASLDDAQRTFDLTMADNHPRIYPGTEVRIFADDGTLLLDGFGNKWSASFSHEQHDLSISGRSGSQDAVDASAEHETGNFKNKNAQEISNELAGKVDCSYKTSLSLPKIPYFQMNQGERIHQVARRLAATYGATIKSGPGREMEFWTAESASLIGVISEGIFPLKSATGTLDDSDTHDTYSYKSQLSGREQKYAGQASEHEAKIEGSGKRKRPYIGVLDSAVDKDVAQNRADWKTRRKESTSKKVEAVIYGHTINGTLVEPGVKLYVTSGFLAIDQEMLVESCTWGFGEDGTTTTINLVPPESYKGKSSKSGSNADSPFGGSDPKKIVTMPPGAKDLK